MSADTSGEDRQYPFAVEQALSFQLVFEPGELFIQRTQPGRTHLLDRQLEITARLIERGKRQHFDQQPVTHISVQRLVLVPEHHTAYLRLFILEREIPVA